MTLPPYLGGPGGGFCYDPTPHILQIQYMREPEARNRQYIYFLLASHENISKLLPKTLLVLIQCDTLVTLCDMFMTWCDTL